MSGPKPWWEALCQEAHAEAARELLRADEIKTVLGELAAAGISPILFKGTALAYSIYPSPICRPRNDTDLLIAPTAVDAARRVFAACGYAVTVHCADLFSQFEVQRVDRFGVLHVFDVHWKISTQPVFENLLTYDDLARRSQDFRRSGRTRGQRGRSMPCCSRACTRSCIIGISSARSGSTTCTCSRRRSPTTSCRVRRSCQGDGCVHSGGPLASARPIDVRHARIGSRACQARFRRP